MARTEVPAGTRFAWEQAERRLEAQMRHADALDTKAGVLVGLHALAAGLIGTTAGHFRGSARWVLVAVIVGLVLSGALAVAAFGSRRYDRRPAPEDVWQFGDWREDEIQLRLLSTRFQALARNARLLDGKARALSASLIVVGVIALVSAISAIVGVVRH